jgi:hippurate hydrolase
MDEEWRFKAHDIIKKHTVELVHAMGAEADILVDVGYPTVYNNEALNEYAKTMAEEFMGKEAVEETEVRMGAEDFGYYSQHIPGCFFRLGTASAKKGTTSGVHTPTFDIDEDAIEIGIGMMAAFGAIANFSD